MDITKVNQIILDYVSEQHNCNPEDWNQEATVFVTNDKAPAPFLQITTMGKGALVSASPELYPYVENLLQGKCRDEVFECPLVYGQSIYYVPDLSRVQAKSLSPKCEYRLYKFEEVKELRELHGFENSIGFDEHGETPTCIALCASIQGEIIAIAGASKENDFIWQVGVDVLPKYRNLGLATGLVSNLTMEILKEGIVPIYCASVTNVGSQAVAARAGYLPRWVSTYRTILDGSSSYNAMLQSLK